MLASACGYDPVHHGPDPERMPAAPGLTRSVASEICDPTPRECFRQMLLEGHRGQGEGRLLNRQVAYLRRLGWTVRRALTDPRIRAMSPDRKLSGTLATQGHVLAELRRFDPHAIGDGLEGRSGPRMLVNEHARRPALVATVADR